MRLIANSEAIVIAKMPNSGPMPGMPTARASGWTAGCSKLGGLFAQGLSVFGLAPPLALAAALVGLLVVGAFGLTMLWGRETRGRDLRDLEGL